MLMIVLPPRVRAAATEVPDPVRPHPLPPPPHKGEGSEPCQPRVSPPLVGGAGEGGAGPRLLPVRLVPALRVPMPPIPSLTPTTI